MKNIKDIKSTITGLIITLFGLYLFYVSYTELGHVELSELTIPLGVIGAGVVLILAPDKFLEIIMPFMKQANLKKLAAKIGLSFIGKLIGKFKKKTE